MANSYIPRKQSLALAWMKTFAGGIAANPWAYQLSIPDATAIQLAVDAFAAAYAVAVDPAARTAVSVARKDEARVAAETICQQFYSLIKPNAGVSDGDKIAIGVRPLNRNRSPISCPQTSPLLGIVAATPGAQTLRYRDSLSPDSGGKPFGATFIEMRVAVADEVVSDVDRARPAGMFTRNPMGIAFTHADDRKKATYFARWVSRRGEFGPWSSPVSMSIAA